MVYDDVAVVVLAAGKGLRMKSEVPKVLHALGARCMVVRVIETAVEITDKNVHVVVGHEAERVRAEISRFFNVNFVYQENLLGTGDAVKHAIPWLNDKTKDIVVLYGDIPFIKKETIVGFIRRHKSHRAKTSILVTEIENPTGYGRIILDDDGNMLAIREEYEANEQEKKIKKINTGICCFEKGFLASAIELIRPDNKKAEYYLTDVVEIARNQGEKIFVQEIEDSGETIGVNTPEELKIARATVQEKRLP